MDVLSRLWSLLHSTFSQYNIFKLLVIKNDLTLRTKAISCVKSGELVIVICEHKV